MQSLQNDGPAGPKKERQMEGRLDRKIIVLSGGTRGMGEAQVRGMVREGARAVLEAGEIGRASGRERV